MQAHQVKESAMRPKGLAIERAIVELGGKDAARKKIGVSFTTVHAWQRQGYIKDIRFAKIVSDLTGIPLGDFAADALKKLGREG
jgi:hypothetical protein